MDVEIDKGRVVTFHDMLGVLKRDNLQGLLWSAETYKFIFYKKGEISICVIFPFRDTNHSDVARMVKCSDSNFIGAGIFTTKPWNQEVVEVRFASVSCCNLFSRDSPSDLDERDMQLSLLFTSLDKLFFGSGA